MKSHSKRLRELDTAKGLAMFLVVFGHTLNFKSPVFNWIFSFHMPLFFFLTGMTFRPEKYETFGQAVRDKFRARLVPYFFITFVGFLICMIRPLYREAVFCRELKSELLSIFYYGQPVELYIGQVWFLAALFFAELMLWLWFRCLEGRSPVLRLASLGLAAAVGIHLLPWVNWLFWKYEPLGLTSLPWKLDTACTAFLFLAAGYYFRSLDLTRRLTPLYWALFPLLVWANYIFGPAFGGYSNMCDCVYPPAPLYLAGAFSGIAAVYLTAVKWKRVRFLQFTGRHSLFFFAAQTFVNYLTAEVWFLISGNWYEPMQSMPGTGTAFLFACASFAVMALILYLWRAAKRQLIRRLPPAETVQENGWRAEAAAARTIKVPRTSENATAAQTAKAPRASETAAAAQAARVPRASETAAAAQTPVSGAERPAPRSRRRRTKHWI